MAQAKKSAAKTAAKSAAKPKAAQRNHIEWPTPCGGAYSTIYFHEAGSFAGIFVAMAPSLAAGLGKEALIGDEIVADDFLPIAHFEAAFLERPVNSRFISVMFFNRSQTEKTFELAFVFGGDAAAAQRFTYTVGSKTHLVDRIDVTLVP